MAANNLGATNLLNPSFFDMNLTTLMSQSEATEIAKFQLLQNILQVLSTNNTTTSIPQNIDQFYAVQLSEYLKLNPQHLQNLQELAMNEAQTTSSLPSFSAHDFVSPSYSNLELDHQEGSKGVGEQHGMTVGKEEYGRFESVPPLVPASPENVNGGGKGRSDGGDTHIELGNTSLLTKQNEHLSSRTSPSWS
ncbi:hypothetical protein Ccrd_020834 [Cynara cardunculus var. scolymus]|uniref:Uncharacterized protein n=1 Tax=Cynara cardunculus var. scolymus TaxID=59895 RepID=A0A103Y1P8_CYNCS|nr:hypothetical protein Ccrd_020834 [Cynara cardunculus var. scolymus]